MPSFSLVVPSLHRPSLELLLRSLDASAGPAPEAVYVVDDRPGEAHPVSWPDVDLVLKPLRSGGLGPAGARNVGWRATSSDWVVFVDDDVVLHPRWLADLAADLDEAPADVAGVQGRIEVPLPEHRRPTDWERSTAGLERAVWITADLAYRRDVLEAVDGFDERFPRAFREDADIALRVLDAGHRLQMGRRRVVHPPRPARWSASIHQQRGNADDVLMRRLHGPRWRDRAGAPRGRRPVHLATTALTGAAVAALALRRPRIAAGAALAASSVIVDFTVRRVVPGPRTADEIARMTVSSVAIPYAATWSYLRGLWQHRAVRP